MKFFSMNSGNETAFGAPGGGSLGATGTGATTGAGGGGGGGGAGAGFKVTVTSGVAAPARQLSSFSNVMKPSRMKRTR